MRITNSIITSTQFSRGLFFLVILLTLDLSTAEAKKRPCSKAQIKMLFEKASRKSPSIKLNCSLNLQRDKRYRGKKITKQVIIEGDLANGNSLNFGGAVLDNTDRFDLVIRSRKIKKNGVTTWIRPSNIKISHLEIIGAVRIYGMALNGEGLDLKSSSRRDRDHIKRAQAAAPRSIHLHRIKIRGVRTTPLYLAPGVTRFKLTNSIITGRSVGPGVYLDAESSGNLLKDNRFDVETRNREQIAIDGSARNKIISNSFTSLKHGGIFIYRNCGEGGTVRHQMPNHNEIINNFFYYKNFRNYKGLHPAIWVASRKYTMWTADYCHLDQGFPTVNQPPFNTSGDSDMDVAKHTVILNNQFLNRKPKISRNIYNLPFSLVAIHDQPFYFSGNQKVSKRIQSRAPCFYRIPRKIFHAHGDKIKKGNKFYLCFDGEIRSTN